MPAPLFKTKHSECSVSHPRSVVMFVFMFILVFILLLVTRIVVIVVIGHIVADRTTCCAAQTRADQATGGATDTVADDLPTRRTETSANSRLGLLATLGGHCAPGRATYAGADRCASATAHSLTDHAAKGAADTATDSRVGGFAGEGVLRYKQT